MFPAKSCFSDVEGFFVGFFTVNKCYDLHEPRLLCQAFVWRCFKLFADVFNLIKGQESKDFQEANSVCIHNVHPELVHFVWRSLFGIEPDAVRFLKIFTFLSLDEIEDIRKQFEAAPHERLAQKVLAREVVTLVHGEEAYKEALNITEQLFAGNIKNLSVKELKQGLRGVPNYQVQADENHNIVELLVSSGVVNSKRQAREDVQNGAIYVNGDRIQDLDYVLSDADKLENELTVIRRGKKKIFCIDLLNCSTFTYKQRSYPRER